MKEKDFWNKHSKAVSEAKELWANKAKESYKEMGDVGPIIMGDGIMASLIPKRCRKPQNIIIISSAEVASCQGNAHYERHASEIVEFLKEKGVECWYHYGMMD